VDNEREGIYISNMSNQSYYIQWELDLIDKMELTKIDKLFANTLL